MNDHSVEQTESMAVISDVKHYAVDIDENGNEVRREISPIEFEKAVDAEQSK